MEKGEIILVPFPFTDLKGNKNRPALVLSSNERDVTVSFISTQLKWKEENDVLLKPSQKNGLKKESLVRLSKIATIDRSIAIGKLGDIEANKLKEVDSGLKRIFRLDR